MAILQIQNGSLVSPYCFTTFQQLLNDFSAQMYADLASVGSFVNYGESVPSVDNRVYPWIRTVGGLLDGVYNWLSGYSKWGRPYLSGDLNSSNLCMLWLGDSADIDTIDGGDSSAVTPVTGPFWELVTTLEAKIPMGVGTLASGATINQGSTHGNEKVTLAVANLPPHAHNIQLYKKGFDTGGMDLAVWDEPHTATNDTTRATDNGGGTGTPAAAEAFSIVPPVYGLHFIKRTARIYKVV